MENTRLVEPHGRDARDGLSNGIVPGKCDFLVAQGGFANHLGEHGRDDAADWDHTERLSQEMIMRRSVII